MESNWKPHSLNNVSDKRICGRKLSDTRGEGGVKAIFCLLVVGLAIYAGIGLGIPYYKYLALEDNINQLAGISIRHDDELRLKLMEQIESLGIPIKSENIKVSASRKNGNFIHVSWEYDVYLLGQYVKTYDFNIKVGKGAAR